MRELDLGLLPGVSSPAPCLSVGPLSAQADLVEGGSVQSSTPVGSFPAGSPLGVAHSMSELKEWGSPEPHGLVSPQLQLTRL